MWLQIVWEQLKWLPTTIIFFNSVLFHMTEVCAIYFLGLPVVWGATSKVRQHAHETLRVLLTQHEQLHATCFDTWSGT